MEISFSEEIKARAEPKLQKVLEQFAGATLTLTEKSLQEVPWNPPRGDVRSLFNHYIELLWAAYVVKFSSLMRDVILAVNQGDFLTYGLIGRSMIEHAAVLRYYHTNHIVPRLQQPIQRGTVSVEEIQELIVVLDQHLRGSRFDWESFFKGDFDTLSKKPKPQVQQVRVNECITQWAKESASVGVLYDLFCDLVHPNVGSTLLMMRVWPDGIGFGGERGRVFGFDLFYRTFAGLAAVVEETALLLNGLLFLRFP